MTGREIRVVPADEAEWDDLQTVFGSRGMAARCQCQRYKLRPREHFAGFPVEERAHRLRQQTDCGQPGAATTSGLVAYLDDEPVGWCAVEPRPAYAGLVRNNRVPWDGRDEDKSDESVRAVTCPFTTTNVIQEELHVGTVGVFVEAGLREIGRPTPRRAVVRIGY